MNHAKNGTIQTSIKNSIFDPIFIRFRALYPPSLHSIVGGQISILQKICKNNNSIVVSWEKPIFKKYIFARKLKLDLRI